MQETDTFEFIKQFPDPEAEMQYASLVGIDHVKTRLAREAAIMLNPKSIGEWSEHFYGQSIKLVDVFRNRPPLFIFHGDVGTGKTALAESFADQVARTANISVTFYKLSLSARGSGVVGEMTKLISQSFERIKKDAQSPTSGALVFFIDEADALAQSREASQMHHEDRAGVNALIRGIDSIRGLPVPVLVVMCTNRHMAIDPAVRRRSAATFEFNRPSKERCGSILADYLSDIGISTEQVAQLAEMCVSHDGLSYGYTYSDIMQRVLPTVLLNAYPDRQIEFATVAEVIRAVPPTAPFDEMRPQS